MEWNRTKQPFVLLVKLLKTSIIEKTMLKHMNLFESEISSCRDPTLRSAGMLNEELGENLLPGSFLIARRALCLKIQLGVGSFLRIILLVVWVTWVPFLVSKHNRLLSRFFHHRGDRFCPKSCRIIQKGHRNKRGDDSLTVC